MQTGPSGGRTERDADEGRPDEVPNLLPRDAAQVAPKAAPRRVRRVLNIDIQVPDGGEILPFGMLTQLAARIHSDVNRAPDYPAGTVEIDGHLIQWSIYEEDAE